jgi:predicted DNA-binding transcriptional regulator YafY
MSYFEFIDRMKRLDSFIRSEITGTAEELSTKLGVCRRTVFEYLDILKSKGAEIEFRKHKRSYCYSNPFELDF